MEIELRVMQFWTEIKLVIANPASRSYDFVIARLISVQIALHSVQLPLNALIIAFPRPYLQVQVISFLLVRVFILQLSFFFLSWGNIFWELRKFSGTDGPVVRYFFHPWVSGYPLAPGRLSSFPTALLSCF